MAWCPGGEAAGGPVQGEDPDPEHGRDQRDDCRLSEEPAQSRSSSRQQHSCGGGQQHHVLPELDEEILLAPILRTSLPPTRDIAWKRCVSQERNISRTPARDCLPCGLREEAQEHLVQDYQIPE